LATNQKPHLTGYLKRHLERRLQGLEGQKINRPFLSTDVSGSKDEQAANTTVETIKNLGKKPIAVDCDVSKTLGIKHLFETARLTLWQNKFVVVNAVMELIGLPVSDFTENRYVYLFSVNTKGAFFTMQEAANRWLITAQAHQAIPAPAMRMICLNRSKELLKFIRS